MKGNDPVWGKMGGRGWGKGGGGKGVGNIPWMREKSLDSD